MKKKSKIGEKIKEWLQEAGYKSYPNPQIKGKELLPEKSVVNITNIKIEKNGLLFMINLKIPTISTSDKTDLLDEDSGE